MKHDSYFYFFFRICFFCGVLLFIEKHEWIDLYYETKNILHFDFVRGNIFQIKWDDRRVNYKRAIAYLRGQALSPFAYDVDI